MRRAAVAVAVSLAGMLFGMRGAAASTVVWTPAHQFAPPVVSLVAWGDLDADGDDDVSSLSWGEQFWSVGCPGSPAWQMEEILFPFLAGCSENSGTLGDCDADGDLDLIWGCREYVSPQMVWNVGSPQVPAFSYGGAIPGAPGSCWDGRVCLADLDADGDLDLVIVSSSGVFGVLENEGSAAIPYWVFLCVIPGIGFGGGDGLLALGDLDGDGDLDIVGATMGGHVRCWENVGTPQAWSYVESADMLTGVTQPDRGVWSLALPDVDCDGDCDLFMGGWGSEVYLYLNERITPVSRTSWGTIKAFYR